MKVNIVNQNFESDYVKNLLKLRGVEDVDEYLNPTAASLLDFNLLDYNNEKYFIKESRVIELKDNLNIYYYNMQFVETNSNEVRIEFIKPKYCSDELIYDGNNIYVNRSEHEFMNSVRFAIDAFNDKYVFDNTDTRILIYANIDNIKKINKEW